MRIRWCRSVSKIFFTWLVLLQPCTASSVEGASAPHVTPGNLFALERFWPYQVTLRKRTPIPGRERALPAGLSGVLVRMEGSKHARVDLGREGVQTVPVANTDLVDRADRIRRGAETKMAPNFVLAVATRLADSSAPTQRPFGFAQTRAFRFFLCVFDDTDRDGFHEVAAGLASLAKRKEIGVIVFPQGDSTDASIRETLQGLDWAVPFVYQHFSAAYTRSLTDAAIEGPHFLLQSAEGRVLLERGWSETVPVEIATILDDALK